MMESVPGKAATREGGGEQRWYHGAESAVLWFGRVTPRLSIVGPGKRKPGLERKYPWYRTD